MPVLGHSGVIHKGARPNAAGKARFFDRKCAPGKGQISAKSLMFTHHNAQNVERLDNLNFDGSNRKIHPLHREKPRRMQAVLDTAANNREMRIGDI